MSSTYNQLLDATIQHLEDLKSRGVRHVAVAPETLRALAQPVAGEERPAGTSGKVSPPSSDEPAAPSLPKNFLSASVATRSSLSSRPPCSRCRAKPFPAQAPPLDPQAKAAAFAALRERALACVKCPHLASSRKNVVFGVGSIDAQLMFVGEAPGADEDEQGEPFVGKAGQLLTKIIQATGLATRGRLHRQHFEMPARHARPVRRQPQADHRRDGHVHSVSARAD